MKIDPIQVLLVEDDEEDYILLQKVLAKIPNVQYELIWEASYASGLARMLESEHDLSLLDYRLGAQNGIDLTKDARSYGYSRPIILLTGANEGEIDIQALQAGADDYIAKEQLQSQLLNRVIRYAIQRKKAEHERENLLRQQVASKELEQRRNEFISMVVHELKTPLTSLKGYAQLLHRKFSLAGDEQVTRLATRMDMQINKLNGLISDFQDVTRIEGGKLQFQEDYFAFDTLVDEILEDLQLTNQQQKLLKEGQSSATLWGDQGRIGQVIINLVTNAMKYAPETASILVKISTDADKVLFCVQDFGPGISKEQQRRIFDPFYRVADQSGAPGLGLGLYISSEIIQRHDGSIWVESEEGNGATFCFTLPLKRKNAQPIQEGVAAES